MAVYKPQNTKVSIQPVLFLNSPVSEVAHKMSWHIMMHSDSWLTDTP